MRFRVHRKPAHRLRRDLRRDLLPRRGADPLVDYVFELERPDLTVRQFEWQGVFEFIRSHIPLGPATRWLDFGCGNGGLVRHVLAAEKCDALGYDLGWITSEAIKAGIPIIDDKQLQEAEGTFDVVTALEVLEHVADPADVLRRIRRLLRPGGLFFYTTGNAARHRKGLAKWGYVRPDIHVSYFEPRTLERLLRETGFITAPGKYGPGCGQIIKFKVLKNLGIRRKSALQSLVPWDIVGRLLNWKLGIFDHPLGWAPGQGSDINRTTTSMNCVRVGIVGCGLIGNKRLKAIGKADKLVAAADSNLARAQQLAAASPGAVATADWRELVKRDDVDLVVVATTNDMLAPVTLEAIQQRQARPRRKARRPECPGDRARRRRRARSVQQVRHSS